MCQMERVGYKLLIYGTGLSIYDTLTDKLSSDVKFRGETTSDLLYDRIVRCLFSGAGGHKLFCTMDDNVILMLEQSCGFIFHVNLLNKTFSVSNMEPHPLSINLWDTKLLYVKHINTFMAVGNGYQSVC